MRVLLTGSRGFVGSHLQAHLRAGGHEVIALDRRMAEQVDGTKRLEERFEGAEVLVHAGGATPKNVGRGEEATRNYEACANWSWQLAHTADSSSLRCVIHLSSVAVLGSPSELRKEKVDDRWEASPASEYGRCKEIAEYAFSTIATPDRLVVSLRTPLIYARDAGGSWALLMRLARRSIPLPFASVKNRRSFLSVENLLSLVDAILQHSGKGSLSGCYAVADREIVSLAEVCTALRGGRGAKPALFPFPPSCLALALRLLGKGDAAHGLFSDLVVDASRVEKIFAWKRSEATLDAMGRCLSER